MLFVAIVFCSLIGCSSELQADAVDLKLYEKRFISQNGEDGVLQKIFNLIGTTSKYYVEFGALDGHLCANTKYLREKYGWNGLLLDCNNPEDASINLHNAFITAENIVSIFKMYDVPQEFDLISIDIDFNDFYVWKALSQYYRPRVVIIEFNCVHDFDEDKIVIYDPKGYWDCTDYYGASILSFYRLGRKLGYSLVYQESQAVNLFFIRDDVLEASGIKFKNTNDVPKLHSVPRHRLVRNDFRSGNPYDPSHRLFISSDKVT